MINLFVSLSKRRGRWRFLLAAALATAALGLWGMRLAPDGRTFLDDLYQLRDLFSFGLSLELGNANWQLQVARWLGPLVAAAALLEGLAALSRRRADAFRARRTRGHTVVLGLGDRGIRIATALAAAGRDVAAVEIDPTETGVGILRHRDGRVVEGDARLHHQLEAAGVPTASAVIVVCGSDATNAEVVAAISDLERAPDAGPLNAAVHLSDAGLCALMRHQSLRTATRGVRFDFFDVYSAGARLFLSYHPLADAAERRDAAPDDRRPRPVRPLPPGGHGARGPGRRHGDHDHRPRRRRAAAGGPARPAGPGGTRPDRRRRRRPRPAGPRRLGAAARRRWHRASRRSRSASTTTRGQSRRRS